MQHRQVQLLITLLTCMLRSSVLDSCAWRRSMTPWLTLTGTHADVVEAFSAKQKLPVRCGCRSDHEYGHLGDHKLVMLQCKV